MRISCPSLPRLGFSRVACAGFLDTGLLSLSPSVLLPARNRNKNQQLAVGMFLFTFVVVYCHLQLFLLSLPVYFLSPQDIMD